MTVISNLRDWRELGLQIQQQRQREKISISFCAEQLGASAQMLLDLESANVFPYSSQSAELGDLARRYLELLGIPVSTFATLLINHVNDIFDEDECIPSYLKAKP